MCVVCALDCAHGFRRLCGGFLMLSKLVIGFALLLGSCAARNAHGLEQICLNRNRLQSRPLSM